MNLSLAEARPKELHEGHQPIPGFSLVRRRGRGGFGEVWEAEASGGFLIALKFVRLSNKAQTAELRALEFVRGIHHPNLLSNFGSWQVADTLIIGMELADRSLWDRHVEASRQGLLGIPRGELLGYLGEVAAGIGHLNEYRHTVDGRTGIGVQHRDLKPSNILLFGGGAKVADLGLARAMEGEIAGHTGIWTFSYAAPEFFRGETARQSDQYSLAITYCQLRGGRLPFEGSAASVTAGHLFGRPDLDALPEPERPIVERALAKVPGDRWPDCRAFIDALRALSGDDVPEILVDPDGPSEIPREFRSSTGGVFDPVNASDAMESGTAASEWRQLRMSSRPEPEPSADDDREPDRDGSAPPLVDKIPFPSAHTPTLILPSVPDGSAEPSSDPVSVIGVASEPSARRGRRWRYAVVPLAAAIAVIAVIALRTPGVNFPGLALASGDLQPRPSSHTVDIASGIGAAASESELPEPSTPTPTPLPTPTSLPTPSISLPASGPHEPVTEPAELEPVLTPATPAITSEPALDEQSRPPLILEGPIEMDIADLRARLALPGKGGRGAIVAVPKANDPDHRPLRDAKADKVNIVRVPDRNLPDPAAPVDSSISPVTNREPAPAEAVNPELVGTHPADAAFARGKALFLQDLFAKAVAEFNEAIRLDPGHDDSYLHRAIARHRSGDPRAALADYTAVIRDKPDDILAYLSRGQACYDLKAYDLAIADFSEVIRRRPEHADAFLRRGRARYRSGDFAGSVADLTATLRLDPGNPRAVTFLAESLARLGPKPSRLTVLVAAPAQPPTTLTPFPADAPATSTVPVVADNPRPNGGVTPSPSADPGIGNGPSTLHETLLIAPPGDNVRPVGYQPAAGQQPRQSGNARAPAPAPTPTPTPQPAPPQKRRPTGRRILPWPFSRMR